MKKRILALLCALGLILTIPGCAKKPQEMSTTIFAMDTVMSLTIYHDEAQEMMAAVFNEEIDRLYELERKFSVVGESSDIDRLNAAGGEATVVSPETAELLRQSLALCEQTGGALDITAYPAVRAWGFTTGEHRLPDEGELAGLTARIDYARVALEGETVSLPAGMELDLGAVAKGYAGDVMANSFRSAGVTSALLDLGQSTIAAIGARPDGAPWRIGLQNPEGEGYLGVLELNDQTMGTSGNYQRFFEENGQIYGHIIDPATAAPARSGLASVTVVADSAFLCDGLSTALFVMGLEDAAAYWRENRDFDAIFIEEGGNITITAGLRDSFALTDGYKDREVSVLE